MTAQPSFIRLAAEEQDAVADEYLRYINNKITARPLRGGVIADLRHAATLLKPLVRKPGNFLLPLVSLATAPTDSTEKERNLLRRTLRRAGAAHVSIIPEIQAAALGAGIDIIRERQATCRLLTKDNLFSLEPVVEKIIRMIEKRLKRVPEKIIDEIGESGIRLTGGGASIEGMDRLIACRTGMDVRSVADLTRAIINGAIQALHCWNGKKNWWESVGWPGLSV